MLVKGHPKAKSAATDEFRSEGWMVWIKIAKTDSYISKLSKGNQAERWQFEYGQLDFLTTWNLQFASNTVRILGNIRNREL